jgi:tetratricopeptide (TPR) repeat protein
VDHYLYGRASGDSTIMGEQAAWIIKKDPKNTWGHMMAGLGEWEKSKPDNAVVEKHLKDAINLDPSRPEGYLNLGYLYEDMERWPDAIAAFEAGAVADPPNAPIRDARLTYYATARNADKYFQLLEPMLPKEPLTGTLARANPGSSGTVDMAAAFQGKTTVVEYWAYT